MKRLLAVLLIGLISPVYASVSYHQTIAQWGAAATPQTSGSFTPSLGDVVMVVNEDYSSSTATLSCSGTGTYSVLSPPGQYTFTAQASRWAACLNSSTSAAAQTATVSSSGSGDGVVGWAINYSSVSTVTASATTLSNPGTSTGAIAGTSVSVPAGGAVVALVENASNSTGVQETPVSPGVDRGGGKVGTGYGYDWAEWDNTGGSATNITPSFTASDGNASNYIIVQFVLTPTAGGGPPKSQFFFADASFKGSNHLPYDGSPHQGRAYPARAYRSSR